jgi:hypothetical protein
MLFEGTLSASLIKTTAVISASMVLVACGGGTSTPAPPQNPPPATLTGTFIDSPVANIGYRTDSIAPDATDSQGQFSYLAGESVTFSIGDIDLPPVAAEAVITPLDIIDTQDINDPSVVNIARLLQSLDADGDPTNGISIDDTAHLSATGMSLDFSSPTFDAEVTNLVANSGSVTNVLIDEAAALSHLKNSLEAAGLLPDTQIGSWLYSDADTNLVLTFLDDTRYMVARDKLEIGDPLCFDGMESGTYTWNSETGEFSVTNANDTTGDCGLTSVEGEIYSATVTVDGNTLTLTDDEGAFPLTRVVAANNPLIGSWHFSDSDTNIVITFLDDTRYMVARDKLEIGDPLCFDGMESGTYTWNSETGEFSVTNANDTTGDCGLTSVEGEIYSATVTVSEDVLTLTDDEGSFPIPRVE